MIAVALLEYLGSGQRTYTVALFNRVTGQRIRSMAVNFFCARARARKTREKIVNRARSA